MFIEAIFIGEIIYFCLMRVGGGVLGHVFIYTAACFVLLLMDLVIGRFDVDCVTVQDRLQSLT